MPDSTTNVSSKCLSVFLLFYDYKSSFNLSMVEHTGILVPRQQWFRINFFVKLPLKAEPLFYIRVLTETTNPRPALNGYTRTHFPSSALPQNACLTLRRPQPSPHWFPHEREHNLVSPINIRRYKGTRIYGLGIQLSGRSRP